MPGGSPWLGLLRASHPPTPIVCVRQARAFTVTRFYCLNYDHHLREIFTCFLKRDVMLLAPPSLIRPRDFCFEQEPEAEIAYERQE